MSFDVLKAMMVGASGMKAQGARMRIIAQNMANAGTTGTKPGEDPYRRQIPVFESDFDRELGVATWNKLPRWLIRGHGR